MRFSEAIKEKAWQMCLVEIGVQGHLLHGKVIKVGQDCLVMEELDYKQICLVKLSSITFIREAKWQ